MAARKIAYLSPLYFGEDSYVGGGERYPLNLARGVAASPGPPYEVELISFGERPRRRPLGEGVSLRVLPLAGRSFHYKPLASTGDSEVGMVVGEYTLEMQNEPAHAVIRNLAVT